MPHPLSYLSPTPRPRSLRALLTLVFGICAPPAFAATIWTIITRCRYSDTAGCLLFAAWFLSAITCPLVTIALSLSVLRKQLHENGPSPDGIPLTIAMLASILWAIILIFLPFIALTV